jgi:fumarate reductase iron-sulfur subunit
MTDHMMLQVARYRPEQETEPVSQTYRIPLEREWTVLDGLNHIKDRLDGTLSYRWSCRMGICGSCGVTVNGEPRLGCTTFLADYAPGTVRVEPLRNFPVIRDLIVDIDDVMGKLAETKPWIVRDEEEPFEAGEYLQTPEQLEEYHQYSMCINCMLCYSACPSYALDPLFLGPAAITVGQRYNLDSRDHGGSARAEVLSAPAGVWSCLSVGTCTSVCPKGVDPAGAIQRYKLTAAVESFKSLLWPRGIS